MDNTVLTDAEIQDTILSRGGWTMPNLARAVEAAVLAKVGKEPWQRVAKRIGEDILAAVKYGLGKNATCVPEHEARERERAAWDAAIYYLWPVGNFPQAKQGWCDERDRLYPLPEQKPKGVTLSDGSVWRKDGHWWVGSWDWANTRTPLPHLMSNNPLTPADYRAVADYLESLEGK